MTGNLGPRSRCLGVAFGRDGVGWDSQGVHIHEGNISEARAAESFRERLWPSLPVCSFALLITLSFGVAFAHAYGNTVGTAVFVTTTAVAATAMAITAPVVVVDARGLQAGIAVLPWSVIGTVRGLDASATRAASGPRAHRAAYFLLRGWVPESVIVEVVDPQDPHPYWHVSTRRRTDLVAALTCERG